MISDSSGDLKFVSISSKSFLARVQVQEDKLNHAIVLSDGRIAVAGDYGFCAVILPPVEIHEAIDEYTKRVYPSFNTPLRRFYPLQSAWEDVLSKTISIDYVCHNVITKENCSASLEEWYFAHLC